MGGVLRHDGKVWQPLSSFEICNLETLQQGTWWGQKFCVTLLSEQFWKGLFDSLKSKYNRASSNNIEKVPMSR